ncbi:MAG: tyrosine transporter, partial [Chlamydiia bacterium]|nr:tyrosine transporter [Chlamydiia bacterium]
MKPIENKTLGGILLVCGTGIGAGMLALPISTGLAGYVPTILMMEAFWLLITYSALLMLEVNLWMPDEANMITMASRTLGNWGKGIAFTFYLLLLYALTTAYLALFSNLLEDALLSYIQIPLPKLMSGVLLACLFILFVQKGTERIDTVNRCFMLGLVVTFCMLIAALFPHIDTGGEWLYQMDWHALSLGFPLIATSFGFHIIIPSLSTYLDHDVPHLKNVLISGSFVISGIYFIWLLMTLSVIPLEGEYG